MPVCANANDSAVAFFPGALGDFLCWLPTLWALRQRHRGRFVLVAHPSLLELVKLEGMTVVSIDRREIAGLFTAQPDPTMDSRLLFGGLAYAYSWTGHADPVFAARLREATGGQACVYPFHDMRRGEHAVDYYGRCIGAAVDTSVRPKVLAVDREWATDFVTRNDLTTRSWLLVHPGSGAKRKNWHGFNELARGCRAQFGTRIVAVYGPAEAPGDVEADVVARNLSLPRVAALLAICSAYVGNDSGISHLAGAVGSRGLALFGPSDPIAWAPSGGRLSVLHAPAPCDGCGPLVFCTHRLPVAGVMEALGECIEQPGSKKS